MHTQSYISRIPSNHADIGEFSQQDADALTLEVFQAMDYAEQLQLRRLFPDTYARCIALQEQARNAKQGRTS